MSVDRSRRDALLASLALALTAGTAQAQRRPVAVEVFKTPTCGCCNDWIKHLEAEGFAIVATDVPDTRPHRARLGMPARYGSCHTAVVGGFVIEGHVPAREIRRLLRERPAALGLAVPGMPIGSPGMDGPQYGGAFDPYHVLLIHADGSARVYASYGASPKR